MKDLRSSNKHSLTAQIEQAAFQNDKQTMVGLIYLIVFITSMIGGSVMYFYDTNSYLSLFLLAFVCVFGLILNRAGHPGSSAVILIAVLLIVIQFNIFAGYGIHDVTIVAWPALIFFSGLLFGWRVIPYVTTLIMGLAIVTRLIPNSQFFPDYSDTGDLIVILLILLAFSIIAISLLRSNEHLIQHLQQSDERFKAIYNSINDAIFIHDIQTGAILDVNEKMSEMFGYTHDEAILLDVLEISSGIPPYTQENALEWIKKAATQGAQHFEWQVKYKSGRLFWVDVNMKCATIASQVQVLVSVRDITERRQADEELLKLKLGIERSTDAIFITNPQGVILYTNPSFETIYGYTHSEAMGHTPRILKSGVVSPEQYQQFWATLLSKDIVDGEIINKMKDGRLITIEGSNNPILDAAGNIIGFLGVHRDITKRKHTEAALLESEAKFRLLIEQSSEGIVLIGEQMKVIEWNSAQEKITGISRADALGTPFWDIQYRILPPERQAQRSPEYYKTAMESSLANGQIPQSVSSTEIAIQTPSGERKTILQVSFPIHTESGHRIGAVVRDITERKQRENELQAIASLSAALRTAPTRAEMMPVIVEQLSSLLHCDSVSAEIIDPITNETVVEAAYGPWTSIIGFRQPPGTGVNAVISKTKRPHHNNRIKGGSRMRVSAYPMNNILASAGVPLIAQDKVIGFLWIGHSQEIEENQVRLLEAVADIAANAIYRATLHEQTQKDATDLALAYDTTLEGWAHALELRDQETEGHTRRVVKMTLDLARALGIGELELENVRRGALLHDIGKMGIPDSILLKPGSLKEREWETMQQHPEHALKLLKPIEYLRPALEIPYCHHEKWDGSGYPLGLKGEMIPLAARIFAIVDVWDALTSDRPYRLAWSKEKALAYIKEQSGQHFDPTIVEAFLKIV